MFEAIETIRKALTEQLGYPWIAVAVLAALPIVEARLAVPMALSCGMGRLQSFVTAFLGSSLPAPLLLLALIPFIRWLAKTKVFKRLGETVYDKFVQKSKKVDENASDLKKMLALFLFVAIPLPLTGVWTGCAVASIIGLKYHKALVSVLAGNAVACGILTLLCSLLPNKVIDIIMVAVALIAVAVVVILLVKAFCGKKKSKANENDENAQNKA